MGQSWRSDCVSTHPGEQSKVLEVDREWVRVNGLMNRLPGCKRQGEVQDERKSEETEEWEVHCGDNFLGEQMVILYTTALPTRTLVLGVRLDGIFFASQLNSEIASRKMIGILYRIFLSFRQYA